MESGTNQSGVQFLSAWLLYLLPWWVLIPAAAWLLYNFDYSARRMALERAQSTRVSREVRTLTQAYDGVRRDIALLARLTESAMTEHASTERTPNDLPTRLYRDFLVVHGEYMQLRLLTPTGQERIRLDRVEDGIKVAAAAELQNKSHRYYVQATQTLARGEYYLSPLDLNVEHHRIEVPHRPTLRVAMKVYELGETPSGIVVLNLDAGSLLTNRDASTKGVMVVNAESYWLRSTISTDEWGFMFKDPSRRLSVRDPDTWRQIHAADKSSGQFINTSGLWTFQRVAPDPHHPERSPIPVLYAILHLPTTQIVELRNKLALRYGLAGGIVLLVVSTFALMLARTRAATQTRAGALAAANERLEQALVQLQATQQELVRTEKLSSLGLMVAGVSHELNTPIGAVMLTASALMDQLAELRSTYQNGVLCRSTLERSLKRQARGLGMIDEELSRAATLIRQFKQVAIDRANADRRHFQLAIMVADVCALMQGQFKHTRHRLEVGIPGDIEMDSYPGPLGQIIQNLIQNAFIHAFAEDDEGEISVRAKKLADGEEVDIAVIDNGVGIEEAARQRVFDPFYTTDRGHGSTGLGLHIAHHLTTAVLGGRIWIEGGGAGHGTTVRLHLPVVAPLSCERCC